MVAGRVVLLLILAVPLIGVPGARADDPPLTSPPGAISLGAPERRKLLAEFKRAQANELASLKHRHAYEIKELRASQKARDKAFVADEQAKRMEFRKGNPKGRQLRDNVSDYRQRWSALRKLFEQELEARRQEHDARARSLKLEQADRLLEAQRRLDAGETSIPRDLWAAGSP